MRDYELEIISKMIFRLSWIAAHPSCSKLDPKLKLDSATIGRDRAKSSEFSRSYSIIADSVRRQPLALLSRIEYRAENDSARIYPNFSEVRSTRNDSLLFNSQSWLTFQDNRSLDEIGKTRFGAVDAT